MEAVTSIFGVRSTLLKATMTALSIIHAYLQDALQVRRSFVEVGRRVGLESGRLIGPIRLCCPYVVEISCNALWAAV